MGVSGHRSVVEEVMKCVNDWEGRVRKCLKCCAANSKKKSHMCIMERDVCLCWQLLQFHLTSDILSKGKFRDGEVAGN